MKTNAEIAVTLSDDLLDQLRSQSRRLHIPLKWLVASLVCDTFEPYVVPAPIAKAAQIPVLNVA